MSSPVTPSTEPHHETAVFKRVRVKKCPKCGQKKAATAEFFAKHDTSSDGLSSYCKACRNNMRKKRQIGNIRFRMKHHIATRVARQLGGATNLPVGYVKDLNGYLGYNMTALCDYLNADLREREGISLKEAVSRGYHLDHIYPLSLFPVEAIIDNSFKECWAINNLRMISAEANLAKGAKVLTESEVI